MNTTPKNPTKAPSDNVQAIRPAGRVVEPREGWKLRSDFGLMCTPEGDLLVRLADVLRWLEESQSGGRGETLSLLCDVMPSDVMQSLYWVQPLERATPVPPDDMWGFPTTDQIEAQKVQNRQNAMQRNLEAEQASEWERRGFGTPPAKSGKVSSAPPEPTKPIGPGLPALLKLISDKWSKPKFNKASKADILDDPRVAHLSTLAIRVDKAFDLWGWGRVVGDARDAAAVIDEAPAALKGAELSEGFRSLCLSRSADLGADWNHDQRRTLVVEVDRLTKKYGRNGVRRFLATLLGLGGAEAVSKQIRNYSDDKNEAKQGAPTSKVHRIT